MKKLILVFLVVLLLISPVCAKECTTLVDDKKIICYDYTCLYILHTVDFGDIKVYKEVY